MKECTGCHHVRSVEFFDKNSRARDGLQSRCKFCFKEYNAARYREQRYLIKQKVKAYRLANPERIRAAKRAWKRRRRLLIKK